MFNSLLFPLVLFLLFDLSLLFFSDIYLLCCYIAEGLVFYQNPNNQFQLFRDKIITFNTLIFPCIYISVYPIKFINTYYFSLCVFSIVAGQRLFSPPEQSISTFQREDYYTYIF